MNSSDSPVNILKKTRLLYGKIEDAFLIFCFSTIAIALLMQIIFRYFLNSPLVWTEELSRYLLVWITFFGINYGLKRNKHIKMEFFFKMMPEFSQHIVVILTQTLLIYFMIRLFNPTYDFIRMQMNIASSAMQVNMGLVYIALPIGFFLSSLSLCLSTLNTIITFTQSLKRG